MQVRNAHDAELPPATRTKTLMQFRQAREKDNMEQRAEDRAEKKRQQEAAAALPLKKRRKK